MNSHTIRIECRFDVDNNGRIRFDKFTSIGCYPLIYLANGHTPLCADCARTLIDYDANEHDYPPIDCSTHTFTWLTGDIHWEGSPIECAGCNADIESAYGDPEE